MVGALKYQVVYSTNHIYIYVEREGFIEPMMGTDEICLNGDWSTPIIPYLGNQVFTAIFGYHPGAQLLTKRCKWIHAMLKVYAIRCLNPSQKDVNMT
jgi:hypothetical protein